MAGGRRTGSVPGPGCLARTCRSRRPSWRVGEQCRDRDNYSLDQHHVTELLDEYERSGWNRAGGNRRARSLISDAPGDRLERIRADRADDVGCETVAIAVTTALALPSATEPSEPIDAGAATPRRLTRVRSRSRARASRASTVPTGRSTGSASSCVQAFERGTYPQRHFRQVVKLLVYDRRHDRRSTGEPC